MHVGVAADANILVPLFTTKKGGQSIGVVLARDIVEQRSIPSLREEWRRG
jgi:hypothetical protein